MRQLINDIQLLNSQLINLVQDVDAGDILSVAFNDIDQLINGSITSAEDISTHDLVLLADGLDNLVSQDGLRNHGLEVDGTLVSTSVAQ